MRKMLNTLFVTTEDAYLSLENENIVVHVGEEKRAQYPLLMLEGILTFSYKGASPALMGACAERGIGLTFLTPRGRFLARVCGSERGNVLLRREQYRRADSLSASCLIARNFIFGKVYNQRWVLERTIRDHALRVNVQALKDVSAALDAKLPQIERPQSPPAAGQHERPALLRLCAARQRLRCRAGKRRAGCLRRLHAPRPSGAHVARP